MAPMHLFAHLRSTAFQDVAGSHISARIPIAPALLNRIIADALKGKQTPVRSVEVQPRPDDQFELTVTLSVPFVPPLKVTVVVAQQPRFPESPVLVLRWSLLGGLGAFASKFTGALRDKLPAGVRMDGDRIVLDIPVMVENAAADSVQLLLFVRHLELHTAADRVVIDVEIAVP
jgi:hypothetical protein